MGTTVERDPTAPAKVVQDDRIKEVSAFTPCLLAFPGAAVWPLYETVLDEADQDLLTFMCYLGYFYNFGGKKEKEKKSELSFELNIVLIYFRAIAGI